MSLIVAITGASGVIYGIRLLEVLNQKRIETHLIVSNIASKLIEYETGKTISKIKKLASKIYDVNDLAALPSTGSFKVDGMVIIPCSFKTLSAIAHGYADNLITRAADVMLKQSRPLILVPRETPLNLIHLENLVQAKKAGAIILPAMPAFYFRPKSIDAMVDFIVGKVLEILNIPHDLYQPWRGKIEHKDISPGA
ncbi:MAG: UbiX family flavin prenyltransferase [Euryarchaeota archaeon]|nr:UbiX family flavin prenyltransferase [Euryarchaeota archaeon]